MVVFALVVPEAIPEFAAFLGRFREHLPGFLAKVQRRKAEAQRISCLLIGALEDGFVNLYSLGMDSLALGN